MDAKGGFGPKWAAGTENLRNEFDSGRWKTSRRRLKSTAAVLLDNFKILDSKSLWDATLRRRLKRFHYQEARPHSRNPPLLHKR